MIEVHNGIKYECSDKYSNKDMTGWDLSDRKDMDGIVIHGLCLSNETPDAKVLPPDLTGCTFISCNLDNVFIPEGNTVLECSVKRFQSQNDLEDWVLDKSLQPVEPLNKAKFSELGISLDPKSIPVTKSSVSATQEKTATKMVAESIIKEVI